MLPQSHIAYTLAAYDLLQKRVPALRGADYRLIALAGLGPDLIDKPLAAVYFYRRYKSAVLFAHTLLAHLTVLGLVRWRRPRWLPYALAFVFHAVTDRLWFFPDTFYWPLRGWRFHVWQKRGSEQTDIKRAYWYAFTRRPELWPGRWADCSSDCGSWGAIAYTSRADCGTFCAADRSKDRANQRRGG